MNDKSTARARLHSSSATRTTKKKTHYEILNVSETATYSEMKAAHRSLILKNHPDKQQQKQVVDPHHTRDDDDMDDEDDDDSSMPFFVQIQNAWQCLRDPKTREEYNEMLQRCRDRSFNSSSSSYNHSQPTAFLYSSSSLLSSSNIVYTSQMKKEIQSFLIVDDTVDEYEHKHVYSSTSMIMMPTESNTTTSSSSTTTNSSIQSCIVYTYPCRCGDEFQVLEDDLILGLQQEDSDCTKKKTCLSSSSPCPIMLVLSCPSCSLTIQVVKE